MKRRLFSIAGMDVYFQPAAAVFAVYMLLIGQGLLFGISIVSILMHEAAHALVAGLCGHPPADLEITPLGALMRLEDEETLSVPQRFLVLLSGPAVSFMLCLLAILLAKGRFIAPTTGWTMFSCNLGFLLFNLLPALPLDGGRMLALLLSLVCREDMQRRVIRAIGTAIGAALIMLNVWLTLSRGGWNLSAGLAGCFLIYSASVCTTSRALSELRAFMDRKIRLERRGSLPCQYTAVMADQLLRDTVKLLHPRKCSRFLITERGTMHELAVLSEEQVIAAYLECPSNTLADLLVTGQNPCAD